MLVCFSPLIGSNALACACGCRLRGQTVRLLLASCPVQCKNAFDVPDVFETTPLQLVAAAIEQYRRAQYAKGCESHIWYCLALTNVHACSVFYRAHEPQVYFARLDAH